jgi:hypothetical protein
MAASEPIWTVAAESDFRILKPASDEIDGVMFHLEKALNDPTIGHPVLFKLLEDKDFRITNWGRFVILFLRNAGSVKVIKVLQYPDQYR